MAKHLSTSLITLGPTSDTKIVTYFRFEATDTVGYLALNHRLGWIILSYRGTGSIVNWIEDLRANQDKTCWHGLTNTSIKVHAGFYNSYLAAATLISEQLPTLMAQHPEYKVVLTGHSLGGALAILTMADLLDQSMLADAKVEIVTFGSPRVGNEAFVHHYQSLLSTRTSSGRSFRIVNNDDPIPHILTRMFGYRHTRQELWIDFDGKLLACDPNNGEDPDCSNSVLLPINLQSHLVAFGVHFDPLC